MPDSPESSVPCRATLADFLAFLFAYIEFLLVSWQALEQGLEPCARPVSREQLRSRGAGDSVLLWMLYQAHIHHLQPIAPSAAGIPKFRPVESVVLNDASCFALTAPGAAFADLFLASVFSPSDGAFAAGWDMLTLGAVLPHYDRPGRVLHWGAHALKRFRQPSHNQDLVLAVAEELGWPSWFDDPLPRTPGQNPKVRLHDTIKCLNRHQRPYLIRFVGDGTGTRLGWQYR